MFWLVLSIVRSCYGSLPFALLSIRKFCEDAFRTILSSWPKKSWRWWVSLPATSGWNWRPPVGCGTSWTTLERRWADHSDHFGWIWSKMGPFTLSYDILWRSMASHMLGEWSRVANDRILFGPIGCFWDRLNPPKWDRRSIGPAHTDSKPGFLTLTLESSILLRGW